MRKSAFVFSLALTAAGFSALLCAPASALRGAAEGLSICAETIIPALLPYLTLSGLLIALGIPSVLARLFSPLMRRCFGLPGAAAAPLLLGLLGGYPSGAAAVAALVRRGELSPEDGSRALPLCNNTGPAFIIGAAGSGSFGSTKLGLLLYLSHILAAFAVGLLFSAGHRVSEECLPREAPAAAVSLASAFTDAVRSSVAALLNICGFVVLFSTLRSLLDGFGIVSGAAGMLSSGLHLELQSGHALLAGFLELGSGIAALRGMSALPRNLALCSFILGFGSLSVHCQTLAAVAGAELKTARHFAGRLLHGGISALITYFLVMLPQT